MKHYQQKVTGKYLGTPISDDGMLLVFKIDDHDYYYFYHDVEEVQKQETYRIINIDKAMEPSVYEKEIWNKAIEAAAKRIDGAPLFANEVLKLKKV